MIATETYSNYLAILKSELVPALGCTEPIAVAYAAAKARVALGAMPERAELRCSGNIIKNVKGVTVPNTGGLKGVAAAAVAGVVGGDAEKGLEVLAGMGPAEIEETGRLLAAGFCSVRLAEGVEGLFIEARVFAGKDSAEVVIEGTHTNVSRVSRNGELLAGAAPGPGPGPAATCGDASGPPPAAGKGDRKSLNVRDILEFAQAVRLCDVGELIAGQVRMNSAISDEGLSRHYGVDVGKTLLKCFGGDVKTRAKARAAAGSDARMSGCAMPVVINSGSGNQGMTASLPVIEYAKEFGASEERLCRALVLSNLVAIHQKTTIGRLSAYCGAVSAACGAGAGITYLSGGGYEEISRTIINTIANVGGMVCDGAKPSCAAKIASAVDAAIMAHHLSAEGKVFGEGEGLVMGGVEGTIASVGRMGGVGMRATDLEVLRIMTGS